MHFFSDWIYANLYMQYIYTLDIYIYIYIYVFASPEVEGNPAEGGCFASIYIYIYIYLGCFSHWQLNNYVIMMLWLLIALQKLITQDHTVEKVPFFNCKRIRFFLTV